MALATFNFTGADWTDPDLRDGRYVESIVQALRYKAGMVNEVATAPVDTLAPYSENKSIYWDYDLIAGILTTLKTIAPLYYKTYVENIDDFDNHSFGLTCNAIDSFDIKTTILTWDEACRLTIVEDATLDLGALGIANSAILNEGQLKKFIRFVYTMLNKILVYPRAFTREISIAIDYVPTESFLTAHHSSLQSGEAMTAISPICSHDDLPDPNFTFVDDRIQEIFDAVYFWNMIWYGGFDCDEWYPSTCVGDSWWTISIPFYPYLPTINSTIKKTSDIWTYGPEMSFDTGRPVLQCDQPFPDPLCESDITLDCTSIWTGSEYMGTFGSKVTVSAGYNTGDLIIFTDGTCSVCDTGSATHGVGWYIHHKQFDMTYDTETKAKDYYGADLLQEIDSDVGQFEVHKIDDIEFDIGLGRYKFADSNNDVLVDRNITSFNIPFGYAGNIPLGDLFEQEGDCLDFMGFFWYKDMAQYGKYRTGIDGAQGLTVYTKYPINAMSDLPSGFYTTLFTNE